MRQDTSLFRVGTEYYRPPMPAEKFWEKDFAAIRETGMDIVRVFVLWNWLEPRRGLYEFEDLDKMFDVACKNNLFVALDLTLATHGAAPAWMHRDYPDISPVLNNGEVVLPFAGAAAPLGAISHCFDHPKWRELGEKLIRAMVTRYKDAPNLALYNVWDAIEIPWTGINGPGLTCYCKYTVSKYKDWLKKDFSIEQLNEMWRSRYRCWEDIEPPRAVDDISGMLLWRLFLRTNLAATMKWQVDVIRNIDKEHEITAHTPYRHGPGTGSILSRCSSDERNARIVDSWGICFESCPLYYSNHSSDVIREKRRNHFCEHCLALDWQRNVGKDGRFWLNELCSGMNTRGLKWSKQAEPEDLVSNLWLSLATGAKGTLFWQYRPEYKSFEAIGGSLVSPNGSSTDRLSAVSDAIKDINSIQEYLPLIIPKAEIALVYHEDSQMMFDLSKAKNKGLFAWPKITPYQDEDNDADDYGDNIFGVYRALWEHNIPVDIIAPSMDWSKYKVIYLPNTVLLDRQLIMKITQTINEESHTHIVADGIFGSYDSTGRFSYDPPEGVSKFLGVRVLDYSLLTEKEISEGAGILSTEFGQLNVSTECQYAALSLSDHAKAIAHFGSKVVGIQTKNKKFTWFSISLGQRSGDFQKLIIDLAASYDIRGSVESHGDRVVIRYARSRTGGWLIFVFNLEEKTASVKVEPSWEFSKAKDLLANRMLITKEHCFGVNVKPRAVQVIFCQ